MTHLVGPPTRSPADVRPDLPSDRITAIAPLPDGRVAFTHATHDALRLSVFADQAVHRVRPAGDNPLLPHPWDLGDHPSGRRLRREVHHVQPITPAPDGRLVTVGFSRDGTPQISLLDIYSGHVDTIARLTDVRPQIGKGVFTPSKVVSVAPWNGTDLLVLADGQLRNLRGVFPAPDARTRRRHAAEPLPA